MAFQAKITRARFVLGPFTSEDMETIGNVLVDKIKDRIGKGMNCNDAAARPLKPGKNGKRGYPDYKAARGLQAIRDWLWTGRTMRSLKVKSASENRAVIGFIDPRGDQVAHANNLREKQFGISPSDRAALAKIVRALLKVSRSIVQFRRAA